MIHKRKCCRNFTGFYRRDVLKGKLRKDQANLAGNGQPKMPQLGHAWDIVELFIDSKHEEEGKYRAHAFLRFTISACRFKSMARTWVLSSIAAG